MAGGFIGGYTLSEKAQEAIGQGIDEGLTQLSSLAASQAQTPEQAQRLQECVYNTGATALLFLGAKGGKGVKWKGNFAPQSRAYIKQMETFSGTSVHPKARSELVATLKEREYTVLNPIEKDVHTKKFTKTKKDNLIAEWEQQTGQAWPRYPLNMKDLNGELHKLAGKKYQAHHIIPQEFNGPHAWWNMHPAHKDIHQWGIHGKNSELKKIIKKAKQ